MSRLAIQTSSTRRSPSQTTTCRVTGCALIGLTGLLMLTGCQTPAPPGGSGATATPSGAGCTPYDFTPTLPPILRAGTVPTKIVQTVCMNAQAYSFTASVTFDVAGVRDSVATCVPDGTYSFRMNGAVNGNCVGPLGPVFTTTFGADHVGAVTRDNPVCVMLSRLDYRNFNIVGPSATDNIVRDAAKDTIHLEFDFALADQMNKLFHGANARAVTKDNARCSGWRLDEVRPRP